MASVENIPPTNPDSEMEEGEIVDDLDDLSDISSEEEFLLRQRLQVLENYNNVLERKKAKRSSILQDLSEISATDLEDGNLYVTCKNIKEPKIKSHYKPKRKKDLEYRNKEHKKKLHRNKKKLDTKIINETSEESEDEYRNKRRKLANAVVVNKDKNDKSSLSARLKKMLCKSVTVVPEIPISNESKQTENDNNILSEDISFSPASPVNANDSIVGLDVPDKIITEKEIEDSNKITTLIDLCTDEDVKIIEDCDHHQDLEHTVTIEHKDSDDDLELLRQHALKTKISKTKTVLQDFHHENEPKVLSEEDSDTEELRLICLKSALLKKAIEMKQKQKLRKRLSQSSNLQDELDQDLFGKKIETDNNTDIESVDMDIGSDGDDKLKDCHENSIKIIETETIDMKNEINKDFPQNTPKEDELEEDEDLLRAKLLTSLSKNLPNLINPTVLNSIDKTKSVENQRVEKPISVSKNKVQTSNKMLEEKKFIINLGESDSEGEHEATKNLTKMHQKQQLEFQQKLDVFLKTTRMEVENSKLPDILQEPKKPEKYVAKTVKHLPKSEQIEYKNLVKKMAELEKMKQSRQASMTMLNRLPQAKDTLKPRNISTDLSKLMVINNLEEKIALSRKNIAVESAKMLKLKEQATKLSHKYKIVATELRNTSTAISLNKREQKSVQNCLTKIRLQHQKLLKSSTTSLHSKINGHIPTLNQYNNRIITTTKLQKENNPSKKEYTYPEILKGVQISIANKYKEERSISNPMLSIQVDVTSNKKIISLPKKPIKDRIVTVNDSLDPYVGGEEYVEINIDSKNEGSNPVVEKGGGSRRHSREIQTAYNQNVERCSKDVDDYKSPLQALGATNWEADPNAILCPFEVDGECKDPDCKYLHTKTLQ